VRLDQRTALGHLCANPVHVADHRDTHQRHPRTVAAAGRHSSCSIVSRRSGTTTAHSNAHSITRIISRELIARMHTDDSSDWLGILQGRLRVRGESNATQHGPLRWGHYVNHQHQTLATQTATGEQLCATVLRTGCSAMTSEPQTVCSIRSRLSNLAPSLYCTSAATT
jgi:hypothetical protein